MARRRFFLAALLAGTVAGCAPPGPPDFTFGGAGFQPANARLNLTFAERNLGDMSRYRGRPAEAATALAQFEACVAGVRSQSAGVAFPERQVPLLVAAIREARAAIGVSMEVLPQDVAAALAAAIGPIAANDRAGIRTALSNPIFTLGPDATLARLADLPRLSDVESVAPYLTRSAGSMAVGTIGVR
ncbi:hypothetical protein [Roseomonas rosulenta]|uniref:hypothetical protein n=1 Tax=Roseomonas rosulenta TaxID=2748667 RepID=UPI0018E0619C|nr:hypothetical protein [Roseomonas rosulenta]